MNLIGEDHKYIKCMYKKIFMAASVAALVFSIAVTAFAQTPLPTDSATPPTGGTPPQKPPAPKKTVLDVACMQAAIDKRETALITALDKFIAASKAKIEARRVALKAAWALTDKAARRAAIKKAELDYKAATVSGTRRALETDKKTAWNQFKTDSKKCRGIDQTENTGTVSADSGL